MISVQSTSIREAYKDKMSHDPHRKEPTPTIDERSRDDATFQLDDAPSRDIDLGNGIRARITRTHVMFWAEGYPIVIPIAALGKLGAAIVEEAFP